MLTQVFHWDSELELLGKEIRELPNQQHYDLHTDFLHDYWRHPETLRNFFVCKNKAFLKLAEILQVIVRDSLPWHDLSTFHLCEGPGYFIDAVYYVWRQKTANIHDASWGWGANTLNPYFENRSCFEKLIDDSHIRNHSDKWYFGPSDDGDVFKFNEEYVRRMGLKGKFDLVTADGSFNTQGQEDKIEDVVAPLIRAEIEAAILLLKPGGMLIIKMYRFRGAATCNILSLLSENFDEITSYKPTASRPGSGEKYLICSGFGGSVDFSFSLFRIAEYFSTSQQISRIERHLETFKSGQMGYTVAEKEKYIEDRMEELFTEEYQDHVKALEAQFPSFQHPSPWRQMYGHDLIRRNTPENRAVAIENLLNTTYPLEPSLHYMRPIHLCEELLRFGTLWVTSDIPLEVRDSLFLEPIALQAVLEAEPRVYRDIFETWSPSIQSSDQVWRRYLAEKVEDRREGLGYMMNVLEGFGMDHFLAALEDGLQSNITNFALRFPEGRVCNMLWLSRLSASIYILMWMIFDEVKFGETWICWEKKRVGLAPNALRIVKRLREEIAGHYPRTSLRSFMAIRHFHDFHELLCWRNAMCLWSNNRL